MSIYVEKLKISNIKCVNPKHKEMDFIKNLTTFNDRNACIMFEDNSCIKKTYIELNKETLDIKNYINNIFNLPKDICVGIWIKTISISFFSTLHSVLQSNSAFILFESNQAKKNVKIIKDLEIKIVIADADSVKIFKDQGFVFNGQKFLTCLGSEIFIIDIQDYDFKPTFKDIMYVMQTSGTTGDQKYIRVTQESILSNVNHLRKLFKLTEEDYVYFGTPLSFDPCMIEILLPILVGATIVSVSPEIKARPDLLKQIIFPKINTYFPGVTIVQMCPSVFLRWSEKDIADILNNTSLRVLALGGEQFPEEILGFNKNVHIFNLYGITEVSCWASACQVENGEVNLGSPLNDTLLQVRKLDDNNIVIQEGEGVLFIGSNKRICLINKETIKNMKLPLYRSSGDLVSIKDNIIYYKGRLNNMVKRYGYNLNLSTIEQQILTITQLRNKCIWLNEFKKIIAFISLPENNKVDNYKVCDKIRARILSELNDYEVPDLFEVVCEFPLTINGKIDEKYLKKLAVEKLEGQDKNLLETFEALWKKYFDLQEVLCNKTFFELGGSSILLLQFVEELKMSNRNVGSEFVNILAVSTYENICKFLNLSSNQKSTEMIERYQLEKQVFHIKWKFDTRSCVDGTPSFIKISDCLYIAAGNFAGRFVILAENNGEKFYDNWFPKSIENGCFQIKNILFVGCFDGLFYCIDLENSKIKWSVKTGDKIKNLGCPVLDNSGIVFGSYDKHLYCVNIEDGHLIWKVFLAEPITANVKSKDKMLFVGCLRGKIVCLSETSGDNLWVYRAKHPIFSSGEFVTSFNGIVFSDVCSNLYCFDIKTGCVNWIFEQQRNLYSSILIKDSSIFFGTTDKYIYRLKFDATSCKVEQEINIGHKITSTPAFYKKSYIIFACTDGGECFSSPVINHNDLLIGCRDNFIYNIEINLT